MPFLERLHRLHIIVTIYKDCLGLRIYNLLTIHHRMPHSLADACLIGSCLYQKVSDRLCTEIHICFMF